MSQAPAKKKAGPGLSFLMLVFCQLLISVLKTNQFLGPWKTVILIYFGAAILIYWKQPRPREGFLKYLYVLASGLSFIVLALHLLPLELSKRMPIYLAFGLPTFFMATSLYWALPVMFRPNGALDRPPRFRMWILGSLGVAIICALISWSSKDPFSY